MQFTKQQLEAITSRSRQTLVSAAAGSGKTRVLTQRIEALVRGADLSAFAEDDGTQVNPDKMADIQHMLVMTFTRAAAAEMRGRIVKALTNAAHVQENSGHTESAHKLRGQAEAAAGADISTVHSFCNRVIADHYELADVCAGFSILSQDQADQIKQAAAREVFEERYEAEDKDIIRLLRKLTSKGNDQELMGQVLRIYGQMMSSDDGEAWLTRPLAPDWNEKISRAWDELRLKELEDAAAALRLAAELTEQGSTEIGDPKIAKKAETDRKWATDIEAMIQKARKDSVDEAVDSYLGTKSIRFANTDKMPGSLSAAQELREDARNSLALVRSIKGGDEAVRHLKAAHEDLAAFNKLVLEVAERYAQKKRAINKLDYDDLEHKALEVLRQLKNTPESYDKHYEHVFVDEYQDTNKVQESILQELTGEDNSIFMVGDMKQSIYGFRFADPYIFSSKISSFSEERDAEQTRIHMNHNFRSAPAVIDTVNAVMRCLMKETFGGIEYTDQEALLLGRTDGEPGYAKILIAKTLDEASAENIGRKDEAEAEMIATRIAELVEEGIPYSDIAILLRSRSERVNAIERALETRGIPYFAELDFNRTFTELDVFLNLLELIVNERRDVPLLSVLRSYMFGFSEADFARIVNWNDARPEPVEEGTAWKPRPFFYRLKRYRDGVRSGDGDDADEKLLERIDHFFTELEKLRIMGTDMALGRFAEEVGARYGFGSYLLTRPAGSSRKKAYDTLLETIGAQQEIHGNSLFRVLEAVRKIRDTGAFESDSTAAEVDAVRITTIHKSKGLEYPVVFVAGMDRSFNTQSRRSSIMTSDVYGVTMQHVDEESRIKSDTMESIIARRYIENTQKSEELRTLYVAMTRAQNQLYLCGAADDEEKSKRKWASLAGRHTAAKSLLDWLMAAYFELRENDEVPESLFSGSFWEPGQVVAPDRQQDVQPTAGEDPLELIAEAEKSARQDFYGLDTRQRQPAVQGVSKRIMAEKREENEGLRPPYASAPLVPVFRETDDGTLSGAQRGTLLHRVLRYAVDNEVAPEQAIPLMIQSRLVADSDIDELYKNIDTLNAFFESDLYRRVTESPKVLTEQPFELLMDVPADGDYSGGKMRLRGMIDLAFIEDGQWVLVDYKSDRGADASQLEQRYAAQVEYYRKALEALSGMKVKESYLFSLERREAVPIAAETRVEEVATA